MARRQSINEQKEASSGTLGKIFKKYGKQPWPPFFFFLLLFLFLLLLCFRQRKRRLTWARTVLSRASETAGVDGHRPDKGE